MSDLPSPSRIPHQASRIARLATLGVAGLTLLLAAQERAREVTTSAVVTVAAAPRKFVKPQAVNLQSGGELLQKLRNGGYVVFLRHFQTDHSKWRVDPLAVRHGSLEARDFLSCAEQRPLTSYGRSRALLVGQAMRALRVPIGRVLSSPYCRATEGVRLMLDREPDTLDVGLIYRAGKYTRQAMSEHVVPLLGTRPLGPHNTLIMAHRPQMDEVALIAEGEMFVFEPLGGSRFNLVGRVRDEEWTDALKDESLLGLIAVQVARGERAAIPLRQ